MRPGPSLSVVLITPAGYDFLRTTVAHLRLQTVRDQLELVIVCTSRANLAMPESELTDFPLVRVVEIGPMVSTGMAEACGVQAASAEVVVYLEEHSFPEPEWAEALVRAHQGPWSAVGASIMNANPASLVRWANLVTDFGPGWSPLPAGRPNACLLIILPTSALFCCITGRN